MEKLPQELINKIALYLDRYEDHPLQLPAIDQQESGTSKLLPFATISSRWREAVEYIIFHRLRITSHDLSQFQAIVTGNRRSYLKRLRFTVILPEYPEERCAFVESEEEQQSNNECFTQAVIDLFSTLKQWEDAGQLRGLRLQLGDAQSPTDRRDAQVRLELAQRPRQRKSDDSGQRWWRNPDIFEDRWASSFIDLHKSYRIPKVSNIVYLNFQGNSGRAFAPAVGPGLAACLPDLENLHWTFGERDDNLVNDANRTKFAKILGQTKLRKCSVADVIYYMDPPDHRSAMRSRISPGGQFDPFSASLRAFSQPLTSLALAGCIDSSLFWPSSYETCSTPTWPSLKMLNIDFHMIAPSGDWYFVGPDEESDPEFRQHGNTEILDPFLASFAKALQQMPILEHFLLGSNLGDDKGYWEISYHAPGLKAEQGDEDKNDVRVRRLYYTVGEVWRPDEFLAEAFRQVGRERHGTELIERFLGPRNWALDSSYSWL